ncbi:MAG: hypothetical protein IT457_23855 [Planctomycetes bacterium]|nr:hypothetical protein [Planctomycetota bacterium]
MSTTDPRIGTTRTNRARHAIAGGALLLAAGLAACGRAIDSERQPEDWPRTAAEELTHAIHALVPVAQIDGDRCVVRLGMYETELVGTTATGDPIAYCGGLRVALDSELLRRGRIDEMLALMRKAATLVTPPDSAPQDRSSAHGHVRFEPLVGVVAVFADEVIGTEHRFARTRSADGPARREAAHRRLQTAIDAARSAPSRLDAAATAAFVATLTRAALRDDADDAAPTPRAVRRMLRHGFARRALGEHDAARELELAALAASTPLADEEWRDGALRIEFGADAFDSPAVVAREPRGSRLARRALQPELRGVPSPFPADAWLVVDLVSGADPLRPFGADSVRGAHLFADGALVADWTVGTGIDLELAIWRRAVRIETLVQTAQVDAEFLPPHVVISNAQGDRIALVTRHGVLRPPQVDSAADLERFLVDAARQAGDTAHLDLVTRCFVEYALDGADRALAWLPGTATWQGDHHVGVAELLATGAGGVARGDCEDFAALALELLRRRGRAAEEFGLPDHSAALWLEDEGHRFAAHVVQCGLPHSFFGDDPDAVIGAAAAALDPWTAFDPRAVRVLRRSGDERLAREVRIDARGFVSTARARLEQQLVDDLDAGLVCTAADFLAAEVLRDERLVEPGLLRRLGALRLATCEPRGAITLLDRAATQEAQPIARHYVTQDSLLAALAVGDASDAETRLENYLQSARDELAGASPVARTLAIAEGVRVLMARNAYAAATRVAVTCLLPDLDELLAASVDEDARRARLQHVVAIAAALAPQAADEEARGALVQVLERVLATPDASREALRTLAMSGVLRVRLGETRWFAQAAGRIAPDPESPLDDLEAWSRFDRCPESWLASLETLVDRRLEGTAALDLAAIAARAQRAFARADPADPSAARARVDALCTVILAGRAQTTPEGAAAILRGAARRFDRDVVEGAIVRLARAGPDLHAAELARGWAATLHDDGALLRLAWLAVADGALELSRELAADAASRGDEHQRGLRRRELQFLGEGIERQARLRSPGQPPR